MEAVSESALAGENVSKAISDLPGVQWPYDPHAGSVGHSSATTGYEYTSRDLSDPKTLNSTRGAKTIGQILRMKNANCG